MKGIGFTDEPAVLKNGLDYILVRQLDNKVSKI